MNLIQQSKFFLATRLKQHPILFMKLWEGLSRIPIALPHDRAYFAFTKIPLPKTGLFLDIGANNGMSALSFRHLNKDLKILSIEADPIHEKDLQRVARKIPGFEYKIIG